MDLFVECAKDWQRMDAMKRKGLTDSLRGFLVQARQYFDGLKNGSFCLARVHRCSKGETHLLNDPSWVCFQHLWLKLSHLVHSGDYRLRSNGPGARRRNFFSRGDYLNCVGKQSSGRTIQRSANEVSLQVEDEGSKQLSSILEEKFTDQRAVPCSDCIAFFICSIATCSALLPW